jgi:hypothetical protein
VSCSNSAYYVVVNLLPLQVQSLHYPRYSIASRVSDNGDALTDPSTLSINKRLMLERIRMALNLWSITAKHKFELDFKKLDAKPQ